uniref:Uncharacterized protein n=1 Tax=Meloidogyne enterolobii TaxID=390850 RepID=A0A6V7Y1H7_MELEN|nr:unnamed protein product [Meloidogyne enterolobii]
MPYNCDTLMGGCPDESNKGVSRGRKNFTFSTNLLLIFPSFPHFGGGGALAPQPPWIRPWNQTLQNFFKIAVCFILNVSAIVVVKCVQT